MARVRPGGSNQQTLRRESDTLSYFGAITIFRW